MIFYTLVTGLTALLGLGLGLFVYFHRPHTPLKISWVIFSCTVGFWSLGYFISLAASSYQVAIITSRLSHASGAFIPITFFHFVLTLLNRQADNKKLLMAGYVLGIVLFFFCFTPLVVRDVITKMDIRYYPDWGPLYIVYAATYLVLVGYACLLMIRAMKITKGLEQRRIIYLFIASVLGFSGGISLFLLIFNIPFPPYGSALICLYPIIMSYSIVKHQLMEIEVIIRKTIVFAGLASFALAVFSSVTFLTQGFLSGYVGEGGRLLSLFASVCLIVLGYEPLRNFLINLTDRFLFQKKVDYRKLLKEATEYLAELVSLKWQARRVIAFLVYKARIKNASIYAFQSHAPGSVLLQASRPRLKIQGHRTIPYSHPVMEYLKLHRRPVTLGELEEQKKGKAQPPNPHLTLEREEGLISSRDLLDATIALFKEHQAEAVIPCFVSDMAKRARKKKEGRLIRGILFLGPQKSDEPYTEEDLDVFFTLGQESSIAFENARLYDEALHKSRELEEINEKMTEAQSDLILALNEAERSRKEAETSREEALEAKKKTEEMELELIRREKLLFVEKFVKGLAHELNNGIAPVILRLRRIRNSYDDLFLLFDDFKKHLDDDMKRRFYMNFSALKEDIDVFGLTTKHLQGVMNTVTPMQSGDDQSVEPFDLKTYWSIAEPMLAMETHGETFTGVPIHYKVTKGLPKVLGNPNQLSQVMINLFRNAVQAMNNQPDKKITVEAALDPTDQNYIQMRFSDNGPGIPREILPKIFDFQFTTKGEKGHGIGLNQCKLIIEKFFKGTMACESTVGKGTTFIIRLPVWKGEQSNAEENIDR